MTLISLHQREEQETQPDHGSETPLTRVLSKLFRRSCPNAGYSERPAGQVAFRTDCLL